MSKAKTESATPKVVKVKVLEAKKVVVNQVKPQITFVKRVVSKYLITEKLAAKSNTPTKPESIKLTPEQAKSVQGVIKASMVTVKTKYDFTTPDELDYINKHFVSHSSKYFK